MTVPEIQERFNQASQALAERFPAIIQGLAFNAKARVTTRIQDFGVDSKGKSLGKYSETELPSFFLNAKKKKTKTYKALREERGLQTDHIDLTFTGDMWTNLQIVDTKVDVSKYVVTVGGSIASDQLKIDYNSDRYGDILQPSAEEISDLEDSYNEEIDKIIKEFL